MAGLPHIRIYHGDWLRDEIAGCSLGAQGLMLRILFIAHESDEYGYLVINGKPIPDKSLARRCGCEIDDFKSLLNELFQAGCLMRDDRKIIYSNRMVDDGKIRTYEREKKQKQRSSDAVPAVVPPMSRACPRDVPPIDIDIDIEKDLHKNVGHKRKSASWTTKTAGEIYELYPRHIGKRSALKAIDAAIVRKSNEVDDPVAWIIDRVLVYAKSPAGNAGNFTPHPATWFNRDGFDDDQTEWSKTNASNDVKTSRVIASPGKYDDRPNSHTRRENKRTTGR